MNDDHFYDGTSPQNEHPESSHAAVRHHLDDIQDRVDTETLSVSAIISIVQGLHDSSNESLAWAAQLLQASLETHEPLLAAFADCEDSRMYISAASNYVRSLIRGLYPSTGEQDLVVLNNAQKRDVTWWLGRMFGDTGRMIALREISNMRHAHVGVPDPIWEEKSATAYAKAHDLFVRTQDWTAAAANAKSAMICNSVFGENAEAASWAEKLQGIITMISGTDRSLADQLYADFYTVLPRLDTQESATQAFLASFLPADA